MNQDVKKLLCCARMLCQRLFGAAEACADIAENGIGGDEEKRALMLFRRLNEILEEAVAKVDLAIKEG